MIYPPHPLTREQAKSLIDAAARSRQGLRESAHLTVLYRAGLRCAESCNLDMSDLRRIESGSIVVRVVRPKGWQRGAMPREIGLDLQATALLERWIFHRGSEAGPVFTTRGKGRVSPSHLRRLIPRLGRELKFTRRVHPHAFRHTFARELYDEGVGILEIMYALGHSSVKTTQTYLQSIGANEVINVTAARGAW